jgi:hypothetical protein
VDSKVNYTKSAIVSNTINPKVQYALSTETYAPEIDVVSLAADTLDDNQLSLPEKLDDPADQSK